MDTLEENKAMAQFIKMSWMSDSLKGSANIPTLSELKFHESWEWLMPVVQKIDSLITLSSTELPYLYSVQMDGQFFKVCDSFTGEKVIEYDNLETDWFQTCYRGCLEFIRWYNENK